jgi:hypothetical protein
MLTRILIKRIGLITTALLFAALVLMISVWRTAIYAENQGATPVLEIQPTATQSAEATASSDSDYFLAYPGILPGHFLYPLKMVRDRIVLSLTFSQSGKAKRLLLYADKRINSAWMLAQQNQENLAFSTASKSTIYLERSIVEMQKAKLDSSIWQQATNKHIQIVNKIKDRGQNKEQ